MFRFAPVFFAAAVALMACGKPASESAQSPEPSQPAQASVSQTDSTTPPQVEAAPPAALPMATAGTAATESAKCLDLVTDRAFTEAVPVCSRAAGLDPENTAVKQALETARTEAAAAALSGSSTIPIAREDMAGGVDLDGKLP